MSTAPLDDTIIVAVAALVDDKRMGSGNVRLPSHSDIERDIARAGLAAFDEGKASDKPIGKGKRVRATLIASIDSHPGAAGKLVALLLATVRGGGGFRTDSPNYCGADAIANLAAAYAHHGWVLASDGTLLPRVLETLGGHEATAQLKQYADRARRGALDDPLLAGVAKDLLEATATHVIIEKYSTAPTTHIFPALLGQAFVALDMKTAATPPQSGEPPRHRVERAAYELACALNALRNREGTGHGKPWIPDISPAEARFAIESMGNIAALMLNRLSP